jgi:hypothetical protein
VFGDFVRYVQPFDAEAFINTVVDEVKQQRVGNNYLAPLDLARFKRENSWSAAQERFQAVLADAQAPA